MKIKFIIRTLSVVILFSLASCEKFLNVEPRESISDEITIVDETSAKTAVRGIYNGLRSNDYYGYTFQILGFFSADNIVYTGSQIVHQQLTNHTVRADLAALETAWKAIYGTINRANNVIAKVPGLPVTPTFTQAVKDGLVGEAYFVRALAYFDLARTWGGVQLVLSPTILASDLPNVKRSTVQQTYAQVLKDLQTAENLLPETVNRIRATKKTVWALRARYHLYQKEWDDAATYATKVIDDVANYKLVTPYTSFYANGASGTQESVLELYYDINSPSNQAGQWLPSTKGGVGWIRPSSTAGTGIVHLLTNPAIGGTRSALVEKVVISGQDNWFGTFYYRPNRTDPAFLIRTAELYLIRAEANAQSSQSAGDAKYLAALADLNAVKNRSNVPSSTILDIPVKADLLLAIENENRVEFALENHRWYDLVRTGRAAAVLNPTNAPNRNINNPQRLLLPIPYGQTQIDPNLDPNPGLN
ncbi:SusD family protein [compost metagenome]